DLWENLFKTSPAVPRGRGETQKRGRPASCGVRAARRTGYPESKNCLLRSSSLGGRLTARVYGLASGAPASIPTTPVPSVAVHRCGRCESAESRIGLSHCTSERHPDAGETRDWSHHPGQGD